MKTVKAVEAKCKYRPQGNRVVVETKKAEQTSPGGIALPFTGVELSTHGTVVAVGPGYLTNDGVTVPIRVKIGDTIIFAPGNLINIEGEDSLKFLDVGGIYAVVEE